MKIKTAELTGAALDWAVAKCEGWLEEADDPNDGAEFLDTVHSYGHCHYSTEWIKAGPIIEREKIEIRRGNDLYFPQGNENGDHYEKLWIAGKHTGQTPLIAAMRCYVASKLGDEVEVPDELTN